MTVLQIITMALQRIGAYAEGQPLRSDESANALLLLQMMIDSWPLGRNAIPVRTQDSFSMVAGQSSYTVGQNGSPNVSTLRPEKVEQIIARLNSVDYPAREIGEQEYLEISNKTQQGGPYFVFYYKPTYPNGTLYFWPAPSEAYTIIMNSVKPLSSTDYALADEFVISPTYNLCLVLNLAILLAPAYGRTVQQTDFRMAHELLTQIEQNNAPVIETVIAPTLETHFGGHSSGNIYTGEV